MGKNSSRPSMSVSPVNVCPRTNGKSRDITERQEEHPALIHTTASKPSMTERLKSVGNDVNDSTGACAGTVASGRGGALAAQTVSKRKPGYDVTPSGRGGGKATTSVNMRNPCDLVGTVNVGDDRWEAKCKSGDLECWQ